MQLITLDGIDLTEIADAVDARTYRRGQEYARLRAVRRLAWDDNTNALWAVVNGNDDAYETVAYLRSRGGARLAFVFGECSCPVGTNCKHVVAVMITAAGEERPATPGTPSGRGRAPTDWEQGLGALLPGSSTHPDDDGDAVPLGIELSLSVPPSGRRSRSAAPPAPRLLARLVRPGRTGWVRGTLSWTRLDAYHVGDCRPSHVHLLREIYALHRLSGNGVSTYYYSHDEKTIDLATSGNRRLWSLLDEATGIGLAVVHARKQFGAVERDGSGEMVLDVTAGPDPGSLRIAAALRVQDAPGEDPVPVAFLAGGHGVAYVTRAEQEAEPDPERRRFRLAALSRPAPDAVQRMVLEDQQLPVPPGRQERFTGEYYPRLRRLAAVESSDGAFTPPTISEPTLVLRAEYGDEHRLDVGWEWSYEVGGTAVRTPVGTTDDQAFRDPDRERALLHELDVPLERLGLAGDRSAAGRRLSGMDTMRFSTEVLPLLAGTPGVEIETTGSPATYREAGDSLRIGVSTEEISGETDWFDLGVTVSVEGRDVPFVTLFSALAADEQYLLLADGAYFALQKPELQALRTLIAEARDLQDVPGDGLRISRFQAGLWEELSALGVVESQARAWRRQVGGLLELGGTGSLPVPGTLTAQLRPYQVEGFEWLGFLWQHRLGGVLADDMGLGKTLQTLALICHARRADPSAPPFLIVAPTSVVQNWQAEAARFAPGLSVVSLTDTLRRRGQDLPEVIAGADVVVTSYTLFRLDTEAHRAADWSGLILDEAQFAKNHQSKLHQCARRLPAPFKLAITGTPMENNLMELWSLLSITAPGLFPNPTRFKEVYARPIEKSQDAELLARLRRRIRPLIRRRTKEQVAADLPPKQVQRLEVELGPEHRRIYQRHLQRERQKVLGMLDDVNGNRFTILRSLTLLRQLSLHPALIEPDDTGAGSGKIEALLDQLAEVVDGGHRALVFSQFTGFLGHVRDRLDAAGIEYSYLDGTTRRRDAVVRRFTDGDVPVFLISLKAGGFGLNLTQADYCFLLDPWWNPATEAQAIDRTHRIGQTRNVMVYRMIAKDTIEEKVAALADRKAELFHGVLDSGDAFGSALDADDIRALLE